MTLGGTRKRSLLFVLESDKYSEETITMNSAVSKFILILLLACPLFTHSLRRCYSCRSRGVKGDCRDPFKRPQTAEPGLPVESHSKYVDELPCSSGWCSKIMEGVDKNFGDDDYGIATERQCMSRVPSDGKERCAYVKRNHKQVFMCFCKGDLCNGGHGLQSSWLVWASMCFLLLGILL